MWDWGLVGDRGSGVTCLPSICDMLMDSTWSSNLRKMLF